MFSFFKDSNILLLFLLQCVSCTLFCSKTFVRYPFCHDFSLIYYILYRIIFNAKQYNVTKVTLRVKNLYIYWGKNLSNNCWNMSPCSSCTGKKAYWKKRKDKTTFTDLSYIETSGKLDISATSSKHWTIFCVCPRDRPDVVPNENHSSLCRESETELQIPK